MNSFLLHLKTVRQHRKLVRKICFKMGIPLQGLTHDLSKYSITEFKIYKYANGEKSPHQLCREKIGYSPSWIHHYHKNKHHYQYWWDEDEDGKIIPIKMPDKYVIEMFCDMVAAGMTYQKEKWITSSPLNYYYKHCQNKRIQHEESEKLLLYLFSLLNSFYTIKEFYKWYKINKKDIKKAYENRG